MEDHSETRHLTDEQFADLLLGAESSSVQEHLRACPGCFAEAERFSGAVGSFQQQSRLWAERRASALPRLVPRREPAFAWLRHPQAWTAATLAVVLAAGFGVSIHSNRERPVNPPVAQVQPAAAAVTPATLKADNELLSAIDGELRTDETIPTGMYGLTASHANRSKAAKRVAD